MRGDGRSSAELSAEEKDAASHRGTALRALVPHLRALLADGRADRGALTIASGPGEGSIFTVYLPTRPFGEDGSGDNIGAEF